MGFLSGKKALFPEGADQIFAIVGKTLVAGMEDQISKVAGRKRQSCTVDDHHGSKVIVTGKGNDFPSFTPTFITVEGAPVPSNTSAFFIGRSSISIVLFSEVL